MEKRQQNKEICTYNFFSKSRKAAMEMSVGTLVTIVLLMAVLGLGIFLIQKIFSGATDSVDVINDKVMGQINDLFSSENANVIVKLGADRKAKIKRGSVDFGVAIGAKTPDGSPTDRQRLKYKLTAANETGDCLSLMGSEKNLQDLVRQQFNILYSFDEYDAAKVYGIIYFNIPDAITKCSQKFYVDVVDTKPGSTELPRNSDGTYNVGGTFFKIQIT